MKKIVYVTSFEKMPETCLDCEAHWCRLPTNARRPEQINLPYTKKRHKDCPLAEIEIEEVKP